MKQAVNIIVVAFIGTLFLICTFFTFCNNKIQRDEKEFPVPVSDSLLPLALDTIQDTIVAGNRLPPEKLDFVSQVKHLKMGDKGWIHSISIDSNGAVYVDSFDLCSDTMDAFFNIGVLSGYRGYIVDISKTKKSTLTAYPLLSTSGRSKAVKVIWRL